MPHGYVVWCSPEHVWLSAAFANARQAQPIHTVCLLPMLAARGLFDAGMVCSCAAMRRMRTAAACVPAVIRSESADFIGVPLCALSVCCFRALPALVHHGADLPTEGGFT
jgi:uncharacterized membrane protein